MYANHSLIYATILQSVYATKLLTAQNKQRVLVFETRSLLITPLETKSGSVEYHFNAFEDENGVMKR
jgi:hypothetical protein